MECWDRGRGRRHPDKAEIPGHSGLRLQERCVTRGVDHPDGGKTSRAAHLDFHPTKPWMYVSIETQNKMYTPRWKPAGLSGILPRGTWRPTPPIASAAGTVHVHPNGGFCMGRIVPRTRGFPGQEGVQGRRERIVVYSIDQSTRADAIQHIGPRSPSRHVSHPSKWPHARAQHNLPVDVRRRRGPDIPAGLSVFRIGDDGKLAFDASTTSTFSGKTMFWMAWCSCRETSALTVVLQRSDCLRRDCR